MYSCTVVGSAFLWLLLLFFIVMNFFHIQVSSRSWGSPRKSLRPCFEGGCLEKVVTYLQVLVREMQLELDNCLVHFFFFFR